MKSRRVLKRILILILPVVLLSAVIVYSLPFWSLGYVKESVWKDGVLYGADEKGGKIRIFACDSEGRNALYDKIYSADGENDKFYAVEEIDVLESGVCRLLLKAQEITNSDRYLYITYDFNTKSIIDFKPAEIEEESGSDVYAKKYVGDIIWYITNDGSVWQKQNSLDAVPVFLNDGGLISEQNSLYTFGNDGVYFYNADDDTCYVIYYKSGELNKAENIPFGREISSFGKIGSLKEMDGGVWTASFYDTDGRLLPMVIGETKSPIERLNIPFSQMIFIVLTMSCTVILAVAAVMVLVMRFRKTFPTELKIVCLSIPALILIYFAVKVCVESLLKDDVEKSVFSRMYYTADTIDKNADLDTKSSWHDIDVYEIVNSVGRHNVIYGDDGSIIGKFEGAVGSVSVLGYNKDTFFDAESGLFCAPAELYSLNETEYINEAVNSKTPVRCVLNSYKTGKCMALYYPVIRDNGINGIIRILCPKIYITNDIKDQQEQLIYNIFIFLFGIVLFLSVVIFLLLRPLNKVRRALSDFSVGIDIEEPEEGAGTEIEEMTSLLYNMTENVKEHLYNINQLKKAYEPYMPQSLIKLFGSGDIRDISPKDYTVIKDAAILVIDSVGFTEAVPKAGVQEMFAFVSSALERLTAISEREGGVIVQFTDTGISVFFKNKAKQAIKAAVELQKSLQELPDNLAGEKVAFGGGIIYGNISIGVIGGDERMEIRAVSPEMSFARYLQKISGIYNLGILIDETFEEKTENLNKCENIRRLGRIGFSVGEGYRTIYEIFEGQKNDTANLKRMTKKDFELGVSFFECAKYEEAKECFMSVLRKNKDDLAAGRYLGLCIDEKSKYKKGMNVFEQY